MEDGDIFDFSIKKDPTGPFFFESLVFHKFDFLLSPIVFYRLFKIKLLVVFVFVYKFSLFIIVQDSIPSLISRSFIKDTPLLSFILTYFLHPFLTFPETVESSTQLLNFRL